MKKQTDNYWYFTRTERSGVLVLGLLCFLLFMAPAFFGRFRPLKAIDASGFAQAAQAFASDTTGVRGPLSLFYFNPNSLSHDSFLLLGLSERTAGSIIRYRQKGGYFKHPEDLRKIYSLAAADYERLAPYIITIPTQKQSRAIATKSDYKKKSPLQLFVFDPNKISRQELDQLGIPLWISKIWMNYLNKGGRFTTKEDLLKLYGMTAILYQRLEPYIEIAPLPRQIAVKKNNTIPINNTRLIEIPVNQANQAQWEQLDGIGPALAQRIINFREKLGGFVAVGQIAETRGLPDSVFQKIKHQLVAEPVFRYLSVNTADQLTLQEHPYISMQEARALVNYRMQHGPFQDLRHLTRIKIWKPDRLEKVLPYLKLE